MLLQSLTFDHFLIRKVKKNLTLVTQAASKTKLLIEKRERKYFIVSLTTFSCVIQHSTDAVIKKLSALAFSRRNGMRTQAMTASHKISQMNSKDLCFIHCDVMLP